MLEDKLYLNAKLWYPKQDNHARSSINESQIMRRSVWSPAWIYTGSIVVIDTGKNKPLSQEQCMSSYSGVVDDVP